jgi:hypothetical protein
MNRSLFPSPLKIRMPSFRRMPESSFIKALDTGFCRCDKLLEVPFCLEFKELSHVSQSS